VKAIANYLTHYVTKNEGEFRCQIWNCSKRSAVFIQSSATRWPLQKR
jgi:hypothetical protein